jgi:beta-phosphoglucomutase-like phosphatase (HAD superfamily)
MAKLALFDIDGTLLNCQPSHERAFSHVFEALFGIPGRLTDIAFAGMLTQDILTDVCAQHGVIVLHHDPRLAQAVVLLETQMIACMADDNLQAILPGVTDLLETLRAGGLMMGVYTGNPQTVGEALLRRFGLYERFHLFTYGDEGINRAALLQLSLERAISLHRTEILPQDVVVFGDSVHDIQAARRLGMVSVGVATGPTALDDLIQQQPDHIVTDLQDTQALLQILQCTG